MQTRNHVPWVLRLTGCWIIWSVWCAASGWLLSGISLLDGRGHLAVLPVLFLAIGLWLKATQPPSSPVSCARKIRQRLSQPLALIFLAAVGLSLLAGLVTEHPWSFDAATYRLPRVFYWWSAHHWYWIGTLDHRLDYSSLGYEWQMLPLIELTHSDRLIFLISWLPMLLMPGLLFLAFRSLGIGGRSARRWMWLLPTGFCYMLQCSGLQNDGYATDYVLAVIAFARLAIQQGRTDAFWLSLCSVSLLTGARLSNLPLMLPLVFILWPALSRVRWLTWKLAPIAILIFFSSFLPVAIACWQHTGDWKGDPTDQWKIHSKSPIGSVLGNLVELFEDATQPPVLPGCERINESLEKINQTAPMRWLIAHHPSFGGIHYGEMPYEGNAGLGCGVWLYAFFLIAGCWFVKKPQSPAATSSGVPVSWRIAPWLGLISFLVLYAKLGATHTERNAATFYPLLCVPLLLAPRIAALERRRISAMVAGISALAVLPVILLTPARPLIPFERLAMWFPKPALKSIAEKYHFWALLRDNLAPVRANLPPDATVLGYAGGVRNTPYGLCQPFGSRSIIELCLPPGSNNPVPPGLKYAVVTERGLRERGETDFEKWLERNGGEIIATNAINLSLVVRDRDSYENWYVVKFNLPASQPGSTSGSSH